LKKGKGEQRIGKIFDRFYASNLLLIYYLILFIYFYV
jgi:hypothetical protein